jgi:hypothetical protein
MKMSKKRIFQLISSFIDNELNERETKFVEEKISSDKEWEQISKELLKIKNMVKNVHPIPENANLSIINQKIKKIPQNNIFALLPVPRHLAPAAFLLLLTAIVIFAVLIFQRSRSIETFFVSNANAVRDLYASKFVKSDLFPATTTLTNDDVLKFAIDGIIPINNTKDQIFKFVDDNSNGHYFDICRNQEEKTSERNVEDFSKDLELNKVQKYRIDSVLSNYRTNIEASLLVSPQKYMAIDANLWNIKRAIIYDLSKNMNLKQRREFTTYVEHDKDKHIIYSCSDPEMENSVRKFREKSSGKNHFIILTTDSIKIQNIDVDFDSIMVKVERSSEYSEKYGESDSIITAFMQVQKPVMRTVTTTVRSGKFIKGKTGLRVNGNSSHISVVVTDDPNSCRIEISNLDKVLPHNFFMNVEGIKHMNKLKELENLKHLEDLKDLENLQDLEAHTGRNGVKMVRQMKSLEKLMNLQNVIPTVFIPMLQDSLPVYFNNIMGSIDSVMNIELKNQIKKGIKIFPRQQRIKIFKNDTIRYYK